jgi:hypothetical protein
MCDTRLVPPTRVPVGARIPKNCGSLDRALNFYLDEYAQIFQPCIYILLTLASSPFKPAFSYIHRHIEEALE